MTNKFTASYDNKTKESDTGYLKEIPHEKKSKVIILPNLQNALQRNRTTTETALTLLKETISQVAISSPYIKLNQGSEKKYET